jgi:hypothetical protein
MSASIHATVAVESVTPEKAQELLRANTHNRRLRQGYVDRLADAIRRGEWELNGEPIQIAVNGILLNGQHRLMAIVEADVAAELIVVRNLSPAAQDTIDTGSARRLSDVLVRRQESNASTLAPVLSQIHRHRAKMRMDSRGQTAPTPQQALELLDREPRIRDSVEEGLRIRQTTGMSATVAAVMYHLFWEVERDDADEFFRLLGTSEHERRKLPANSPIRRLNGILKRIQTDPTYHPSAYELFAMIIKAFNAWRHGWPMAQLSFRAGGKSPEPFPEIETTA